MTSFKPMLAAKANPAKLRFPLYVQNKFDGIRCSIVGGWPVTRTLKAIPNREIRRALSSPEFEGLDGELIVGDPTAPDCYRRTSSFVMSEDKTGEPWTFYVFDLWNVVAPFEQRFEALTQQADQWVETGRLRQAGVQTAANADQLEAWESIAVKSGHEGIILRSPTALYKFGRASATEGQLLKLKRFSDFEATVVGVYEEQANENEKVTNALGRSERSSAAAGKRGKGTLGGLILVAGEGATVPPGTQFRCGTGFNRAERAELWAIREALPGRIAKIKAFEVGTKDKPRFPTFLGWRDARDL